MKYAGYHIDGSKANEFRTEALELFSNPELKRELQERMINLDRQTMSFDLRTGPETPKEIMELAAKFGTGFNSYSEGEDLPTTKTAEVATGKIKVTGNTYPAKELLKDAGFAYSTTDKAWYGDDVAKTELDRMSTASYSRKNQNLIASLKFENA